MWKQATRKLTVVYTLIFIGFLALFSGALYAWVGSALGAGYVDQVRGQVEQNDTGNNTNGGPDPTSQQTHAAQIAADVALAHFRNVLLAIDGIAVVFVPFGAYLLTRRTLQPLIVSHDQQKQFIANTSHELRTPLAVLNNELELALRKTHSAADYHQTIVSSKEEVDHMIYLTESLLLQAQLDEARGEVFKPQIVALHDLLQDITRQLLPKASVKSITLVVDCDQDLVASGSPSLLAIAIKNLVDNAIKYSPNKSAVKIVVRHVGQNSVRISVSDQGSGIPSNQQAYLFNRFYRGESSRTSDGFGLGLAIVKRIIDIHKGKINFISSPQGTTFEVQLSSKN